MSVGSLFHKGPKIENVQSRLKFSISTFRIDHTKNSGLAGGSLEIFIAEGNLQKFFCSIFAPVRFATNGKSEKYCRATGCISGWGWWWPESVLKVSFPMLGKVTTKCSKMTGQGRKEGSSQKRSFSLQETLESLESLDSLESLKRWSHSPWFSTFGGFSRISRISPFDL